MKMLKELKPGVYRHYKGAFYLVHELARFHDSGELMVLYTPLTPHEGEKLRKTVRPAYGKDGFFGYVKEGRKNVRRFVLAHEAKKPTQL